MRANDQIEAARRGSGIFIPLVPAKAGTLPFVAALDSRVRALAPERAALCARPELVMP